MPSRSIDELHPDLKPIAKQFIEKCKEAGLNILITCTYRSNFEQDELYKQGRNGDKRPIVTRAKAGQSAHNFTINGKPAAKAFDIVPLVDGKTVWDSKHPHWAIAGKIGMDLGLNWYGRKGAPFPEMPHFQLK